MPTKNSSTGRPTALSLSCTAVLFLFPTLVIAQVTGDEAVVRPMRVEEPPKIDGRLDEALWATIEPVTDFRQFEPDNGEPGTEKTEVRIAYDNQFLYFGVRAYDDQPGKIIARNFECDSDVYLDDSFAVAIDSLDNDRTAVIFDTNVLGAKLDVQYSEAGAYNPSWDGIWYAKGQIDDEGFTLEIAIPFFALRFKPAAEVEMGLLFERIIPARTSRSTGPTSASTTISAPSANMAAWRAFKESNGGSTWRSSPTPSVAVGKTRTKPRIRPTPGST